MNDRIIESAVGIIPGSDIVAQRTSYVQNTVLQR